MKPKNIILELNSACNSNCIYCYLPKKDNLGEGSLDFFKKELVKYSELGVKNVDFTGGEPTLYGNLLQLVRYAKKLGYTNRTLVTNGRRLSYTDYCRKVVRAGINRIVISFDGPNKKIAEAVTRSPGSFIQTLRALSNVKLLKKVELGVTIVMNSINHLHVRDSIEKLVRMDVDFINVQFLLPYVKDKNVSCRVLPTSFIPSYAESVKHLQTALDEFGDEKKINVHFIPFCYMKGYEKYLLGESTKIDRHAVNYRGFSYNIGEHLLKGSVKTRKCGKCRYNDACVGFFDSYRKEFGIKELQ